MYYANISLIILFCSHHSVKVSTVEDSFSYVLDQQWVACDSLHGFQEEAGQWHSFTTVITGNFLQRRVKKHSRKRRIRA